MEKVLIIINAEVNEKGQVTSASPVIARMVKALEQGIINYSSETIIEITSVGGLWSKIHKSNGYEPPRLYCPLTIQLPEYFNFPAKTIYQACKDISARRRWVEKNLGIKTSVGDSWLGHLWLPVILNSEQNLIYGEIIGEGEMPNSYEQPIEIPKKHRLSLHRLAAKLLANLSAPPSVYLIQFSLYSNEIVFDRLWPFPAAPALASLRGQQLDLFSCHWLCLSQQPITDQLISNNTMPIV